MKEIEKFKKNDIEIKKDFKLLDDVLSFDYYNYRLENLVKKIKSRNIKRYLKACD